MKIQQAKLKISFSLQLNEQKQHLMNSMKTIENEVSKIGTDISKIIFELNKQGFNLINMQRRQHINLPGEDIAGDIQSYLKNQNGSPSQKQSSVESSAVSGISSITESEDSEPYIRQNSKAIDNYQLARQITDLLCKSK